MGELAEFPLDGAERLSRQERLESLRRRMAAIPARGEVERVVAPVAVPADRLLPVPEPLAEVLPQGGLVRGSVVSVSGATSLLIGILASATAAGGHAAVIGHRRLSLLAAAEMGAQLQRVAVIPDPGPDPVEIAAVLLDGMDLVILGLGGIAVPPSRTRAVAARARSKGAVLVVVDGRWDGAQVRLDAQVSGYEGLEVGRGRLCGTRLSVRAQGRAFPARTTRMDVCATRTRIEWMHADRGDSSRRPGRPVAL
ncbi:hypothetical protein ACWDTG_25825 [Rhodococcus zopfii]